MTNFQSKMVAKRELARLNEIIDWKIIRGLSYRREAARHRFLKSRLVGTSTWRTSFTGL